MATSRVDSMTCTGSYFCFPDTSRGDNIPRLIRQKDNLPCKFLKICRNLLANWSEIEPPGIPLPTPFERYLVPGWRVAEWASKGALGGLPVLVQSPIGVGS